MDAETAETPEAAEAAAWPRIVNVAAFLAALVILGAALLLAPDDGVSIAEDEQRERAPAPTLSRAGVLDGSYAEAVEAYIADHFPGRERFLAAHFWMIEHRGLRDERVAFYDVAVDEGAELPPPGAWDELAALEGGEGDAPWELGLGDEGESDDTGAGEPTGAGEDAAPRRRLPARREGGIMVVDGRAMQLFSGGARGARAYARVLNEYERELRGEVRVYSMIVPSAQTFYLPADYAHHTHPEPPNIDATYALMADGVTRIDAVAALAPHTDEYIYFKTDHHWTGLGAYYAYTAICEAAGLEPTPLAAMTRGRKLNFRGSLYRFTRDPALAIDPDYVDYWLPPTAVRVFRYTKELVRVAIKGPLIRERGAGYGVFLGGDFPLIIAESDAGTGRRGLLIKNSFGNPLAVYLASHFDELLIVDYRYFDGSVLDLIRDHDVTDLFIVNGTITANARFHAARVGWVMDSGKRSRAARRRRARGQVAEDEDEE